MVKHIVMWKLKDEACGKTREENAKEMKALLDALPGKIPEIIEYQVGINENGEEYHAILISAFASYETLKIYDGHPEHLKVRAFVKEVAESRAAVDFTYEV